MMANATSVPYSSVMKILQGRGYGEHNDPLGRFAMNRRSGAFYESGDPKLEPCPGAVDLAQVGQILSTSIDDKHAADRIEAILLGTPEPEPSRANAATIPAQVPVDVEAMASLVEQRAVDKILSRMAAMQKDVARLRQTVAELTVATDKRLLKVEARVGKGPGRPGKPIQMPKVEPPANARPGAEIAAEIEKLPDPPEETRYDPDAE